MHSSLVFSLSPHSTDCSLRAAHIYHPPRAAHRRSLSLSLFLHVLPPWEEIFARPARSHSTIIRSKWKMDFDTWITFFLASIPFDGKGDEEFLLDERRESHVVFFFFNRVEISNL